MTDVLVIGGGAVGLWCAYFLRRAGCRVTLVERGPLGGPQSCSSWNTGFVGTQGAAPLAEPGVLAKGLRWLLNPSSPFYVRPRLDPALISWLWHFRRACDHAERSYRILLEMKQRSLSILRPFASLAVQGMVVAFKSGPAFEAACRTVPRAVSDGVPLRVLEPGELAALEPGVAFDIAGALYNEEGAYLRMPEFLAELARILTDLGVELLPDTEVVAFSTNGSSVTGVRTTRGDLHPDQVVLAAGAWSARWARQLGVRLLLQPAKGYTLTVPGCALRRPVLLTEGKVAIAPLGDRLRLGGTLELTGLDTAVAARRVEGILRTVRSHVPSMDLGAPSQVWSGLRPCTPDSLPYLGRAGPCRNLVLACGHGHIGLGLAPVSGKLVAQLLTGEKPDMDLHPFRVARRTA